MRKLALAALAILSLACYHRHGMREQTVGAATLETVYLRYRVPAVYLLFVADVAPEPRGTWLGSGSVGSWNADINQTFRDDAKHTRINAHPITIRFTTLRAEGRTFDLTDGNVLLVHMNADGALALTQLPERRGANLGYADVVALMKAALPHDARVQAL